MDDVLVVAVISVCAICVGVAAWWAETNKPKPTNCQPIAISATTPDGQASTRRGLRCDLWSEE